MSPLNPIGNSTLAFLKVIAGWVYWMILALSCDLAMGSLTWAQSILINEIMYHPAGADPREQWIEIYNTGASSVDLTGWRISKGVEFIFKENTILASGGHLVIAADRQAFNNRFPLVLHCVGPWTGSLSYEGEEIRLDDAQGRPVDSVSYASEGDWAVRRLGAPDRLNRQGWEWFAEHKGMGSSLELVNPLLSNNYGLNWASSTSQGGTPGATNSTGQIHTAPLILDVAHLPVVPKSTQPVAITARLMDEDAEELSAVLYWRVDGEVSFSALPMLDDGKHGDGLARDGVYGARLASQPDRTIIEFYVAARDREGRERVYPRVIPSGGDRTANLAYQVDDGAYLGNQPVFRLIMTRAEYSYLSSQIWGGQPRSNAEVSGTFISSDGGLEGGSTARCRYQCGLRNRGHGTSTMVPHNFHVSFAKDRLWKGRGGLNLNTYYTHSQQLGSAVFRLLQVPMPESRPVQVRVNALNLAKPGQEQFGSYAANEVVSDDFVQNQFALDTEGNLYRGIRDMIPGISSDADLVWHGPSYESYTNAYAKENHARANDWSDLIHLIDVLNNTSDADYEEAVGRVLQVDEWMKYFAINTLLDNQENSLGNGAGDDFVLYRGANDPRFFLLPYDMDSLMGRGTRATSYADGLWRMARLSVVNRFVKHPEFVPIYFKHLKHLAETTFSPARMNPLLDHLFSSYVDASTIAMMKAFNSNHVAYVLSQIPLALTVAHDLSLLDGYPYTTSSVVSLRGTGHGIDTRSIWVNGAPASWSAWQGRWTNSQVTLQPGLNRVIIQAWGEQDREVGRLQISIWYDDGHMERVSGSVAGPVTWPAAQGPYHITGDLIINAGATLVIQPGTTLFLGPDASIVVEDGGRIMAEGTAAAPIVFMSPPGNSEAWGGITIKGSVGSPESRITYASLENNGSTAIHSDGGTVCLDHLTFAPSDESYVSLDDSAFIVSHCIFPAPTGSCESVHGTGGIKSGGYGVFLRNFFGATQGYSDVIDFTGGNRPDPIVHFIDNVFMGSGDDILDLDGADAWVERNIFLHCHRNGSPDSASAISGGDHGNDTSEITIRGNLFYDCDHVVTAKEGNSCILLNNTIVHQTKTGGEDTDAAILNLADDGTSEGKEMYWEGNIIYDAEKLIRNLTAAHLTFTNNLMPFVWAGSGGGNSTVDPLLTHIPPLSETQFTSWEEAQVMRQWFSPSSGSPAIGTGPNGNNRGGVILPGVSLSGEYEGTTRQTSAAFRVGDVPVRSDISFAGWPGGAGYTHYRWRLDGGAWSEETPIHYPLELNHLNNGPHSIEVIGKFDSGLYQNDPLFGADAWVTSSRLWTVDTSYIPPSLPPRLRINEVLVRNSTIFTNLGTLPGLIEILNYGSSSLDLSGMGLTDDPNQPHKYTFPAGSILAGGAYGVLFADQGVGGPFPHTGFSLKPSGGKLYLYGQISGDGLELDAVTFGLQLADLSIGRRTDSSWGLCRPTFGGANVALATGGIHVLKINEWLADAQFAASSDFIELYNPDLLPVALGGLYLSDVSGALSRQAIAPLSFIAGGGYAVFMADNDLSLGAGQLGFKLSLDVGLILLAAPDSSVIDAVNYSSQRADISEGRSPNGQNAFAAFPFPTPGSINPGAAIREGAVSNITVPILAMDAVWRYNQAANLDGINWTSPNFDDSAWPVGRALLGVEGCNCLPEPGIGTELALGPITHYFRTHLVVQTNLEGFQLNVTAVVDDGAVIYLNGSPILSIGMDSGIPASSTRASRSVGNASTEFFNIPTGALFPGTNVLAVEVHQASSGSSDIVWGMALDATQFVTNRTSDLPSPVVLNEILADQPSLSLQSGSSTSFVELYNSGTNQVELSGMSLTDDPMLPRKWIFPLGSVIEAGSFQVVYCDADQPASAMNTGFLLPANGGTILLYDQPARGAGLLDALRYGIQSPGYSMARLPAKKQNWSLGLPTAGAANHAVALGDVTSLRINEWMADPFSGSDWFEVFNSSSEPVSLGGLFLTDNFDDKTQSPIPPLSFIGTGASAFVQFLAGGLSRAGANHVNFALRKSGEMIGLFTSEGLLLDGLAFGSQQAGISQGRFPDGADTFTGFPGRPSPAASNSPQDSDQDGLLDAWELANFNTLARDGRGDFDSDGLSDAEEFLAGTNPADPADLLRVVCLRNSEGVTLEFTACAGRFYTVQYRDSLTQGAWQKLMDIQPSASAISMRLSDPNPASSIRFYRLVIPMQP